MGSRLTGLRTALELRRLDAASPYKPETWQRHLHEAGLQGKYPDLPDGLRFGFSAGIPRIFQTFAPPNHSSITLHSTEFNDIIQTEFQKGRYFGPITRAEVESLIGPFQTSPLSIIPKPGRPGKFRIIQNLSSPHSPRDSITSINSAIDSNQYPCTWGTFSVICLLIRRLPPGSQAAVRDVKEAYRTVPIKPDQWPGLVVRLDEGDSFAIDTRDCFGLASGGGVYGRLGDAGTQIMRARGIGPISKWVDDHIFFRILRSHLEEYNLRRRKWAQDIAGNGGELHDGGRLWFKGAVMPDDQPEEFDEDASFTFCDLSQASERSQSDRLFTYCMADINALSDDLGIPWETEKDIPFSDVAPFIGFSWDLTNRTVSLPDSKKEKYLQAIQEWEAKPKHTLDETQKLYGKLLHACHVVPAGRAYLTNLEAFMGICHDRPFRPHYPPRRTPSDLSWWKERLTQPAVSRPIPGPLPIIDTDAYSDASSEIGIGITIRGRWRAWRLLPGWKEDGRDIGWAEAVGFWFLVLTLVPSAPRGTHIKVFGDNRGVVEGWWKGRSRNRSTNEVFKHVHALSEEEGVHFHTRYVPSKENPADGPSRGEHYQSSLLLPAIVIPSTIRQYVCDFDAPCTPAESHLIRQGKAPTPLPRVDRAYLQQGRAEINHTFEQHAKATFAHTQGWFDV